MAQQEPDNGSLIKTVFSGWDITYYSIKYLPVDTDHMTPPVGTYTIGTSNVILTSGDVGVVEFTINRKVDKEGMLLALSAATHGIPEVFSSCFTEIKSSYNGMNDMSIVYTFRVPASTFKHNLLTAYDSVFEKQFTNTLENELTQGTSVE